MGKWDCFIAYLPSYDYFFQAYFAHSPPVSSDDVRKIGHILLTAPAFLRGNDSQETRSPGHF